MRIPALVATLAAGCAPLVAQNSDSGGAGLSPAAALSLVQTRVRSEVPGDTQTFSGAGLGVQGELALGRLELALSYVQGKIDPESASGPGHDLVEGSVQLGVRPAAWLRLAVGPHARSYTLTGGTQRWVFWETRLRAQSAFIGSAARGYVELWRALSASANVPESFDHAQGGEAGMTVHLARAPFEFRLAYRIDHAVLNSALGAGSRKETVDGVLFGVGLAGR